MGIFNLVLLSLSWCETSGFFWMLRFKVAEGSNDRMSFEVYFAEQHKPVPSFKCPVWNYQKFAPLKLEKEVRPYDSYPSLQSM